MADVLSPSSNPLPTGDLSPSQLDVGSSIQSSLNHIRNKQLALQEQNHTRRQLHQQCDRLVQHVDQLGQQLQQVDLNALGLQLYADDLAEIRSLTDHIRTDLAGDISPKIIGLNLQNAFELLRRLLDEMQADARWSKPESAEASASSQTSPSSESEQLKILQLTLNQQRQHLSNSFLGKALRSSIAKRLNRFAGLLHRIDALSHQPARTLLPHSLFSRYNNRRQIFYQQRLKTLVQQIDQSVDRLDYREASSPALLEETEIFVERQLHGYEYPSGLGWIVNRFHDVNRFRSPQARVLVGLSTSLTVSFALFLALFGVFSLISRNLESNVPASLRLREERSSKLETLSQDVGRLRNLEKERTTNQASLDVAEGTPAESFSSEELPSFPPDPVEPDTPSTRDILQQQGQTLTAKIEDLRTAIDKQLNDITALNARIEETRQTEEESPDDEKSLRDFYSWLNNQQIINHLNRIILAAFAGALGSMMSILIRLDKLDDENLNNPFALGFLKPFIGAVFGVIVFAVLSTKVVDILPAGFNIHEDAPTDVALQRRDPLGDIDSQELYKIFVAAFIAGFSERLANDTLRSFK